MQVVLLLSILKSPAFGPVMTALVRIIAELPVFETVMGWAALEVVLNDEHDDFKWLSPAALGDLKLTGGLPEVLQAAERLIKA